MSGDGGGYRHSFQYVVLTIMVVVALAAVWSVVWKYTTLRDSLWRRDHTHCVLCCDRIVGSGGVRYDQSDLRTLQELEDAAAQEERAAARQRQTAARGGAYSCFASRRRAGPRHALHLAGWREDVRTSSANGVKLMQIDPPRSEVVAFSPASHTETQPWMNEGPLALRYIQVVTPTARSGEGFTGQGDHDGESDATTELTLSMATDPRDEVAAQQPVHRSEQTRKHVTEVDTKEETANTIGPAEVVYVV